jgi:hypothetical protein
MDKLSKTPQSDAIARRSAGRDIEPEDYYAALELARALEAAAVAPVEPPYAYAILFRGEPTDWYTDLAVVQGVLAKRNEKWPEDAARRSIKPLYAAPLVQPVLNGQVIDKSILKRLVTQVFGEEFEIQRVQPGYVVVPQKLNAEMKAVLKEVAPEWNAESIYSNLLSAAPARSVHTDHPLRHYDRTCPACNCVHEAVSQPERAVAPLKCESVPMERFDQFVTFLSGNGDLDGIHFGERHPDGRGQYFWRTELRVLADQLKNALAAPQVAWMPIDTAPKDGTEIFAAQAGTPDCGLIHWDDAAGHWVEPADDWAEPNWHPTVWMPLPAPPTVEVGDQT